MAADGVVTAVGNGVCTITAVLAQNKAQTGTYTVTVEEGISGVHFVTDPPETLGAYQEAVLEAVYTENGKVTEKKVTWQFEGAEKNTYTAAINGNRATIKCWAGSVDPLTVKAVYGGYSAATSIVLEGW